MKTMFFFSMGLTSALLAAVNVDAADASTYGTKDDLLPGGAGMAVKGNLVFTTAGAESFAKAKRLVAIDVANPAAPKVVSSVELKGFPQDLALAGNIAYVVDGLRPERIKPILDATIARFQMVQKMRAELAATRRALEERKVIDRAKGLLMRARNIPEEEAYALLRKTAMAQGKQIGDVAQALVTAAELLK